MSAETIWNLTPRTKLSIQHLSPSPNLRRTVNWHFLVNSRLRERLRLHSSLSLSMYTRFLVRQYTALEIKFCRLKLSISSAAPQHSYFSLLNLRHSFHPEYALRCRFMVRLRSSTIPTPPTYIWQDFRKGSGLFHEKFNDPGDSSTPLLYY